MFLKLGQTRGVTSPCLGRYSRPSEFDSGLRTSPCGLRMSVFLPRKCSSCWPLPRLSGLVSSTLFRIISLTPRTGQGVLHLRCRFCCQNHRTPPLLLGLRALLYRPCQTQAQIAIGDCYVLCGRSGVTWITLLHIVCDVSSCSSPWDVS